MKISRCTHMARPFLNVLRGGAFSVMYEKCRPGSPRFSVGACVVELFLLPPETWSARLIGSNSMVCMTFIPLIGIGPLAIFLLVLRHGAPTRPALAGAVAGLLAGGIAATFYAAKCTDDSPLFVITWYTLAITLLTCAGAIGGRRFARW